MQRRILVPIAAALLAAWAAPGARADADKRLLNVMTRNMDAGSDLEWFLVLSDPTTAAIVTFNEVQASNIPLRAGRLADEILAQQPDLIALEEATLWEAGPPAGPPGIVLDQIQLLLQALTARGLHYSLVAVQTLTTAAVQTGPASLVRFTDRNAILARTDLQQSEMSLSNVQQAIYQARFEFPVGNTVVPELNGWISVDAKVRGKVVRFVVTHLLSTAASIPPTVVIQTAQADELIATLAASGLPVVLAGDFNSNAEPGPDATQAAAHILAAGFTDAWRVFNPPGTGFTWPLFLEDFLAGTQVVPFERIDLIFERGLNVTSVGQTGLTPPWGSDHVGVVATVQIEP